MPTDKHIVRISTRGRITIPAEVRRSLGLRGGDRIGWIAHDDGSLELIPPMRGA